GELESIRPLLDRARREGWESVVTGFSPSLELTLRRMGGDAGGQGGRLRHAGLSPGEGQWAAALAGVRPHAFVTAKYEAWPDLWASLGERKIPLLIVGAKPRGSLRTVRRALTALGGAIPPLDLVAFEDQDTAALREIFPAARVESGVDPRWDRASERARRPSARVDELATRFAGLPKPWGILGSAWPADVRRFERGWAHGRGKGTLWVVPHRVDDAGVREVEDELRMLGLMPFRSNDGTGKLVPPKDGKACVVVNEMGFLSELYRLGDWAYVGGGFGAGVHSTIEPAVHGLSIAAGPARAQLFTEVRILSARGQLTLVKDGVQLASWLRSVTEGAPKRFEVGALLGGTDRIWARLAGVVRP
ncbi:MAG TPA: glycosyltransferase N-terminal domain-containing protein, partial [Bdellovibrionota bacterium]|nr:glycosyltransferase N-terminal domain-containing protein [Bdellovibrionota bacterium]